MRRPGNKHPANLLLIESLTAGLAFGALLWWGSTCLVGSFRPQGLASPYWSGISDLRTDTSGSAAFIVAAICLITSEYLRLHRRYTVNADSSDSAVSQGIPRSGRPFTRAASEAVALLATAIVGYISVNAVTHPASMLLHVTHLLAWPSEGTLRMVALLLSVASVSVLRFLNAEAGYVKVI
jgi:hypothetical protein